MSAICCDGPAVEVADGTEICPCFVGKCARCDGLFHEDDLRVCDEIGAVCGDCDNYRCHGDCCYSGPDTWDEYRGLK